MPPPWAKLPRNVLKELTKNLNTRVQILNLRAVCKGWRSFIPLPPPLHPHFDALRLELPRAPSNSFSSECTGRLFLKQHTVYCIQPLIPSPTDNDCWFVRVEETQSGKVRLLDPLSGTPVQNDPELPKTLNLLDCRVKEVSKHYLLESDEPGFAHAKIRRVVVGETTNDRELVIMALNYAEGSLEVWKQGEDKWALIENVSEASFVEDIAYHAGRFYAVDETGMLFEVHSSSLRLTEVAPRRPNKHIPAGKVPNLVSSFGDLFLINIYSNDECQVLDLDVSILDEDQSQWSMVPSLRDRLIFVGNNCSFYNDCSFSVWAEDFVGYEENNICLRHGSFEEGDIHPGFDAGLFNFVNETAKPLSAAGAYATIFWPPPEWLKQLNRT